MKSASKQAAVSAIDGMIVAVRGERVMLDANLATLYRVETSALNRAVRRNIARFPADFVYQLMRKDVAALRCQIGISKTGSGGRRYLAYVFTEHGAIMAANVLHSKRAIEMSVYVVRAFIKIRAELARDLGLAKRLAEIEKMLTGHDVALRDLYNKIRPLLLPPSSEDRREIGFHTKRLSEQTPKSKQKRLL